MTTHTGEYRWRAAFAFIGLGLAVAGCDGTTRSASATNDRAAGPPTSSRPEGSTNMPTIEQDRADATGRKYNPLSPEEERVILRKGTEAGVRRRIHQPEGPRHLRLPALQRAAVSFRGQIRQRLRMAQLRRRDPGRGQEGARRRRLSHRDPLRELRRTSRPCLPGRRAHGQGHAPLRELPLDEVLPERQGPAPGHPLTTPARRGVPADRTTRSALEGLPERRTEGASAGERPAPLAPARAAGHSRRGGYRRANRQSPPGAPAIACRPGV